MKHTFLASAAMLIAAVGLSTAAFAGPELITNGTFAGGSNLGWMATVNGSGTADTVEVNPSAVYGLPNYNGNPYNMEVNANSIDTVTQTVSGLIVGDYYALSFGYGSRGDGGPQALTISFGGQVLATDCSPDAAQYVSACGTPTAFGTWSTNSFLIEATAVTETLSFASIDLTADGGRPSYGNEISDVSLIPEPASLAMLVIGLTGIGVMRRRRA